MITEYDAETLEKIDKEFERTPYDPKTAGFTSFPLECLAEPVRNYVTEQSCMLDCSPSAVAIPALAALAGSVNASRWIRTATGTVEPAVLWTALVHDHGVNPRRPMDAAVEPLFERQERAFDCYEEQAEDYVRTAARRKKLKGKNVWGGELQVPDLVKPKLENVLTSDTRLKSVKRLVAEQPRGVLCCFRELEGWLGRPTPAVGRRCVEVAEWVSLYEGETEFVEPSSAKQKRTRLQLAAVSLTGTVRPETLSKKLKSESACDLTSRLLFAQPWSLPAIPQDSSVGQETAQRYERVIGKLIDLADGKCGMRSAECGMEEDGSSSSPSSTPHSALRTPHSSGRRHRMFVEKTPEAAGLLSRYTVSVHRDWYDVDGGMHAWFGNLPAQAARLALVLHLTRWAAGEAVDPDVCDVDSMRRGITLARWFGREAERIFAAFMLKSDEEEQFKLIDWLSQRGGVATTRELCRTNGRKYRTEEEAQKVLDKLAESGVARWVRIPPGKNGGPAYTVLSMGLCYHEHLLKDRVEEEENGECKLENGECKMSGEGSVGQPSAECGVRSAELKTGADEGGRLNAGRGEVSSVGQKNDVNSSIPHSEFRAPHSDASRSAVRPKTERWTLDELVAADPREKLENTAESGPRRGKQRPKNEEEPGS